MAYMTWNQLGMHAFAVTLRHRFRANDLKPAYICLQEVGDPGWGGAMKTQLPPFAWMPPNSELHFIQGLNLNGNGFNGYYLHWAAQAFGNPRCSMAILYHDSLRAHVIDGWWDLVVAHRPAFWIGARGGPQIGCIHAPSGGNTHYVRAALETMKARFAGPWRLVGDFNVRFGGLLTAYKVAWPEAAALSFQSSGGATQRSGGNLDYSIGTLPNTPNCASADEYIGGSDHLAVAFW